MPRRLIYPALIRARTQFVGADFSQNPVAMVRGSSKRLRRPDMLTADEFQLPSDYQELLQVLKARIRGAQIRASFAVTRELVVPYWSIGREISQRFDRED
jgi:hypothetical protein